MQIIINYCNLRNFIITKILNKKRSNNERNYQIFIFFIKYRLKIKNSIDNLFRKSDYKSKNELSKK